MTTTPPGNHGSSCDPPLIAPKHFPINCACGSPFLYTQQTADCKTWNLCCGSCGQKGPTAPYRVAAIDAWNAHIKSITGSSKP